MCFGFVAASSGPPPATRPASRRASAAVQCGACSRSYELQAWLELPLAGVLNGEAIAAHVVKWPLGVRIEIRRCARCGRTIARTEGPGP
jgi:hypothetical protein